MWIGHVNRIVSQSEICRFFESVQGKFERQLLDDLLMDYNPLERPVSNESDPLEVTFGISLQQIIDVVRIL
ncbi:acetylcholine receptor subunit alpha-type acr-16-like isoform X4 [Aphis craccivora]|uniref:Acetylcholine receptor subunit alpha-type acr-16-like isoform X4 n=1 Tax=Aphis craccivora TaxID=307492 RepID=A0A6G0ZHR6_APHCR|nr:acetylcholine receptor subunit alpha-type acr-16-like isoform X4 [Aphis craccivora]